MGDGMQIGAGSLAPKKTSFEKVFDSMTSKTNDLETVVNYLIDELEKMFTIMSPILLTAEPSKEENKVQESLVPEGDCAVAKILSENVKRIEVLRIKVANLRISVDKVTKRIDV